MSSNYSFELLPDRFFVTTLTHFLNPDGTLSSSQYLYITNILTGNTLKIENPCFHDSVDCLVRVIEGYGVSTPNGQYKRAIFSAEEILKNLCEPFRFEDDEYYTMVDRFVRNFKPYFESGRPLHHYYLDEDNIFGVSYIPEEKTLIVSNTLNGKAIKIENADKHDVTYKLTRFLIAKGVCGDNYGFCLALLTKGQIEERLGTPTTEEGKKILRKLKT
jgi:hypothetical protein